MHVPDAVVAACMHMGPLALTIWHVSCVQPLLGAASGLTCQTYPGCASVETSARAPCSNATQCFWLQ